MTEKQRRVIGTTDETILKAESQLGFQFPASFRAWLLENNGLSVEAVHIFPVYDERDPRRTWNSIVRQHAGGQWSGGIFEDEGIDTSRLLPFAASDTGNYYCFDFSYEVEDGEVPVVLWSHETGETENRGTNFSDFLQRLKQRDFELD